MDLQLLVLVQHIPRQTGKDALRGAVSVHRVSGTTGPAEERAACFTSAYTSIYCTDHTIHNDVLILCVLEWTYFGVWTS